MLCVSVFHNNLLIDSLICVLLILSCVLYLFFPCLAHPFRLPFLNSSLFNSDIDSISDKPWRRPGVDLTDYFNYGFDEETWKYYAALQIQLRMKK